MLSSLLLIPTFVSPSPFAFVGVVELAYLLKLGLAEVFDLLPSSLVGFAPVVVTIVVVKLVAAEPWLRRRPLPLQLPFGVSQFARRALLTSNHRHFLLLARSES